MRKIVAFEGRKTKSWLMLDNGALKPFDGVIPVILHSLEAEEPIGIASDFRRNEETGEVSFEITSNRPIDFAKANASIYIEGSESYVSRGLTTITHGVIRGIFFSNTPLLSAVEFVEDGDIDDE